MKNPQSSNSPYPGLRAWRHTLQDMVALFILRAKNTSIPNTPAYALTVGVSNAITASVYNDLLPLCQWMIGQPPSALEILSEHNPINHSVLRATFEQMPASMIAGYDSISPGPRWPNDLHRWRLQL